MSFTYAIADLHGRFDLLEMALIAIKERDPGTIVTLGDYVDRGPQSRQIIERLMTEGDVADGWRLVCLKGNHEEIMRLACRELPDASWWLDNGGGATLLSYGHPSPARLDLSIVPSAHLDWIDSLPLMHVDRHRIYVHAGVDPDVPLSEQDEHRLIWKLYQDFDDRGHGDRHVVHGHHQFEDGPICKSGRTDLDTLAWYTGRLVVGVFDDDIAGGPVDFIEIRGEPVGS